MGVKLGHTQVFLFPPKPVFLNFKKSYLIPAVDMKILIYTHIRAYMYHQSICKFIITENLEKYLMYFSVA